ncbi:MAG: hypothetical protein PSN34_01875 [Urechidicola sp.]|nr:hypothetical protein [Urechidicola sp.]
MKNILQLILLLIILGSCNHKEPQKSEEQLLRIPYHSETDQTDREYFVYLPKGYEEQRDKKWPVLLFLHGDGERGNGTTELDYVMIHGPLYEVWVQKRDLPFIMIVPQMHMFGRDKIAKYIADRTPDDIPVRLENGVPERPGYFSLSGKMKGATPANSIPNWIITDAGWDRQEQDLLNMLDNTLANFNADEKRIYLSGLSYGGFGTWVIGSKHANRFAAMNPIVGYGHPDLMQAIVDENLPVWAFAGGRDTAVETQYFFAGMNKLEELGHKDIRFTIHEDMGHDAWKRIYAGQDIYDWFLKYSKNTE